MAEIRSQALAGEAILTPALPGSFSSSIPASVQAFHV
jgi:hypothetical protein